MASVFSASFALRAGGVLLRPAPRRLVPTQALRQWRLLSSGDGPVNKYDSDYFDKLVKDKPLVLFMKGEPSAPMCGFSRLVVQILAMHGLDEYPTHDVLKDVEFKEGMKEYSQWPTFPQVYMRGELVGGADIMLQLHQNGELVGELDKMGHKSALIDADKDTTKQS